MYSHLRVSKSFHSHYQKSGSWTDDSDNDSERIHFLCQKKKTNETLNNWKLNYEDDETINQKRLQDSQAFYV